MWTSCREPQLLLPTLDVLLTIRPFGERHGKCGPSRIIVVILTTPPTDPMCVGCLRCNGTLSEQLDPPTLMECHDPGVQQRNNFHPRVGHNLLFASVPSNNSGMANLTAVLKAPRRTHGTDCMRRARVENISARFVLRTKNSVWFRNRHVWH